MTFLEDAVKSKVGKTLRWKCQFPGVIFDTHLVSYQCLYDVEDRLLADQSRYLMDYDILRDMFD
jgi:hypothetical protein